MNINSRITLAIRKFFKKYGKIIGVVFFIWAIIFIVNQFLLHRPKDIVLKESYTPDKPIMDDTKSVSKEDAKKIHELVDQYFNYCESKEYQKAYDILTDNCKEYVYENDLNNFKEYVDTFFKKGKKYNIQDYSNVDNIYLYILTILDDVESSGTTGGYDTYQERIALIQDEKTKEFKISNFNYIDKKEINKKAEDGYLKVNVNSLQMGYDKQEYSITVTNKTKSYIIIADNTLTNEIELNLGNQLRKAINLANDIYTLGPNETKEMKFVFTKYFDDENESKEIRFNSVRVIDDYEQYITDESEGPVDIGDDETEPTSTIADKVYSMNIPLID